tara:strand:- start:728 stop:874 length:147 start_codon:yes stop_codon:yes gene_type:complete
MLGMLQHQDYSLKSNKNAEKDTLPLDALWKRLSLKIEGEKNSHLKTYL